MEPPYVKPYFSILSMYLQCIYQCIGYKKVFNNYFKTNDLGARILEL